MTDVNARGGYNGDALLAASVSGHLQTTPAQLREPWGENDAADAPELEALEEEALEEESAGASSEID
ncbi:hypothetical protein HO133_002853 [Letharia lupina]|uniref:Uncharacterized protein n=1 Tax=Letharia lupina TaxID=560253 RepID=A0A8H6CBZ9_9LECA|nr:uncharacterized protein HO133_002853 [Letharia lupina]KAF6220421.1 hypothetical protein HO133_002853 [Letharia lupina]